MESIENKAIAYLKRYNVTDEEKANALSDFKNGYKECLSDIIEWLKANPKASHKMITDYLKEVK